MLRYVLTRIFWMVFTFFLIVSLVFIITRMAMQIPWPPFLTMREYLVITFDQYTDYMHGILTEWYWGTTQYDEPVWDFVASAMPISLRINIAVFLSYVIIGIGLGMLAAVKKDTWVDQIIGIFTMTFGSIPSFIMIFLVIMFFGFGLGWLPKIYPIGEEGLALHMGLIIPILALSGPPIATLSRLVRGELAENFNQDYLLLARVKGLNKKQILFRHALRNSITPVMPEIPNLFVLVLMNAFFVEIVYNVPGVANLFLKNIYRAGPGPHFIIDTPIITTISSFYAFMGLSIALLIDILYGFVDPTISVGSKKTPS